MQTQIVLARVSSECKAEIGSTQQVELRLPIPTQGHIALIGMDSEDRKESLPIHWCPVQQGRRVDCNQLVRRRIQRDDLTLHQLLVGVGLIVQLGQIDSGPKGFGTDE